MVGAEEVVQVTEIPEEMQRSTADRQVALVMSVAKGETSNSDGAVEPPPLLPGTDRAGRRGGASGELQWRDSLGRPNA